MTISRDGIAFLKGLEGFSDKPYRCSAGRWTQGWGHTRGVLEHSPPISIDEAEVCLFDDISDAERVIYDSVKVKLAQCEFDALVSFVFNIGADKFLKSSMLRLLNEGDKQGASKEFEKWVHSKDPVTGETRVLKGLQDRRSLERQLFLYDVESLKSGAKED